MTCREFRESVEDLALHEIEPGPAVELRRHSAGCAACASCLAEVEALNRRLRAVRESFRPSEDLQSRIAQYPSPSPSAPDGAEGEGHGTGRAGAIRRDTAAEAPLHVIPFHQHRYVRRILAVAASVLVFTAFAVVLTGPGDSISPVLADTFAAYEGIASRAVPLDVDSQDPEAVEEFFRTRQRLDLSAPSGLPGGAFALAGGCASLGAATGTPLPAVVYRNGGATVVLVTIDRSRFDPSKTHGGMKRPSACGTFHLYERGGVSALACVCMDTVHVWIGRMPPDRLREVIESPPDPTPAGEGVRLAVEDLSCAACCARARGALEGMPGIRAVSVDPRSDEVRVIPAGAGADGPALIEALRKAGFEARVREPK